jgi:hypothetical protein
VALGRLKGVMLAIHETRGTEPDAKFGISRSMLRRRSEKPR